MYLSQVHEEEHAVPGRVREITRESKGCQMGEARGKSERPIKARRRNRRNPYLPLWLQQLLRRPILLKRTLALTLLLLFLLLLNRLATLPASPAHSLSMPATTNEPSQQTHHQSSLPGFRVLHNPYASYADRTINPDSWAVNPNVSDLPKTVLSTIPVPPFSELTPAIIGIRHLVPLAVGSSQVAHKFLGRAITVSTQMPDGRNVHFKGDVHIRIFKRGEEHGWKTVPSPSRAELDHLRAILFRQPAYEEEMSKISKMFEDTCTDFERLRRLGSQSRAMYIAEAKDRAEKKRAAQEAARVPPNTPEPAFKVGPPNPAKRTGTRVPGEATLNADPIRVGEALRMSSVRRTTTLMPPLKPPKSLDGQITIKIEEDENYPYQSSVSSHMQDVAARIKPASSWSDDSPPPPLTDEPKPLDEKVSLIAVKRPQTHNALDVTRLPIPQAAKEVVVTKLAAGPVRTTDEILVEVVDVLRKLRTELAVVLDLETHKLINDVEIGAGRMIELREIQEKKRSLHVKKDKMDGDGDVEMRSHASSTGDPVPAYRPSSPVVATALVPETTPKPLSVPVDVVEKVIKRMVQEVSGLQGKMADTENAMEAKIAVLELRLTELEMHRDIEDGWTIVSPRRRHGHQTGDRSVGRARFQKVEGHVEALLKDGYRIQGRLDAIEKVSKEWDAARRKVNGLDMRVAGSEGEMMIAKRKIAGLESKMDENRLRRELTLREVGQSRNAAHLGLLPRVSKIESRLFELEYRMDTAEETMIWAEQKSRAIWLTLITDNQDDLRSRAAAVCAIWAAAADAFTRRVANGPVVNRRLTTAPNNNPFAIVGTPIRQTNIQPISSQSTASQSSASHSSTNSNPSY